MLSDRNRGAGVMRLRLKAETERFESLTHTGVSGGKGDLRTETRRRDERFGSVRGECVI